MDWQASLNEGIVLCILGELIEVQSHSSRTFMQHFTLVPTFTNSTENKTRYFCIHNDIMRYLDGGDSEVPKELVPDTEDECTQPEDMTQSAYTQNEKDSRTLYIGNLSYSIKFTALKKELLSHFDISEDQIELVKKLKNYAFVVFDSYESAQSVLLQHSERPISIKHSNLIIQEKKPRKKILKMSS
eukprot:TRINITY_DN4266_c0_g1_i1.p1 TRINITY_DN4266_c0_g1~~TRINITY_DN4266_c0_g1_i1.p1  ORF type:complete len:186 (+),score=39.09 TRINITY_DN4266_c0_g1_i1:289-846(+)